MSLYRHLRSGLESAHKIMLAACAFVMTFALLVSWSWLRFLFL